MARFVVQRRGVSAQGSPRHEYLRARPTFVPATFGPDVIVEPAVLDAEGGVAKPATMAPGAQLTEDQVTDLRWTWIDAADPSGWRNGQAPHDFGEARAERWAAMIDGACARRIGDAVEPEDKAAAEEQARRRAARRAYRTSLASGGEPL